MPETELKAARLQDPSARDAGHLVELLLRSESDPTVFSLLSKLLLRIQLPKERSYPAGLGCSWVSVLLNSPSCPAQNGEKLERSFSASGKKEGGCTARENTSEPIWGTPGSGPLCPQKDGAVPGQSGGSQSQGAAVLELNGAT